MTIRSTVPLRACRQAKFHLEIGMRSRQLSCCAGLSTSLHHNYIQFSTVGACKSPVRLNYDCSCKICGIRWSTQQFIRFRRFEINSCINVYVQFPWMVLQTRVNEVDGWKSHLKQRQQPTKKLQKRRSCHRGSKISQVDSFLKASQSSLGHYYVTVEIQ